MWRWVREQAFAPSHWAFTFGATAPAAVQDSPESASAQWRLVTDQLREKFPKLAEMMDAAEQDVLAFTSFPRAHRLQIHSTNPLERLNAEVKRRTNLVGIFPNERAIIRLVGAMMIAFQNKRSVANFGRLAFALVCVAGFNMFLLPFMLVAPLMLLAFYLVSACFFIGGATIAASGLTGIDKFAFEFDRRPMAFVVLNDAEHIPFEKSIAGLNVPLYGIHLVDETMRNKGLVANGIPPSDGSDKLRMGAVYIAAGILFFLFSQKLAGYMGSGARRYLHANASILRGAQKAAA